jgi:P-type Cu+ transporter
MKATDPVCGMNIESDQAAATEQYQGNAYYFCSTHCRDKFKANPAQYAAKAAPADNR